MSIVKLPNCINVETTIYPSYFISYKLTCLYAGGALINKVGETLNLGGLKYAHVRP